MHAGQPGSLPPEIFGFLRLSFSLSRALRLFFCLLQPSARLRHYLLLLRGVLTPLSPPIRRRRPASRSRSIGKGPPVFFWKPEPCPQPCLATALVCRLIGSTVRASGFITSGSLTRCTPCYPTLRTCHPDNLQPPGQQGIGYFQGCDDGARRAARSHF